jgi:type IV pilus assembly protein PilV
MQLNNNGGTHRPRNSRVHGRLRQQTGLTLIEILVSLVVTSVGLLGVAALHLTSLRNNFDSTLRTHASVLANDIADRMRSNRRAALAGEYNIALGAATAAAPATRAQRDVSEWRDSIKQTIKGDGGVQVNAATRMATITINWAEREVASGPKASTISFVTETEL